LTLLTHRGARGAWSAFFSVFASHFHISQPIFKNTRNEQPLLVADSKDSFFDFITFLTIVQYKLLALISQF
jgi:hypothetical protein